MKGKVNMEFYKKEHKHYCGIDLHARFMYICIINQAGKILFHKNMDKHCFVFMC